MRWPFVQLLKIKVEEPFREIRPRKRLPGWRGDHQGTRGTQANDASRSFNWYWQYFQQNRWRFAQRTRTAEARRRHHHLGLATDLSEIDKQFQKTLSYHEVLKKQAIGDYDFLLNKGMYPRATVRPFTILWCTTPYSFILPANRLDQSRFLCSISRSPVFASRILWPGKSIRKTMNRPRSERLNFIRTY